MVFMHGKREQRLARRAEICKAMMKQGNMVLGGGGKEQRLTPLETASGRLFARVFNKGRKQGMK